jgi:3-hydroxyacyl-CoA dehydrogenase
VILQAINKAIDLAEKEYQGLVIGNQAANSVGANIGMIFMMRKNMMSLNMAIKMFQDTMCATLLFQL